MIINIEDTHHFLIFQGFSEYVHNQHSFSSIPEDFATEIELTEEEQIKLLEQYEMEKKNEKEVKKKEPIGEKVIFKQESPKRSNEKKVVEESPSKVNKKESTTSIDTPSSSSSTDGEWEKINDVEK